MNAAPFPRRLLVFADDDAFYAKALARKLAEGVELVATADRAEALRQVAGCDSLVAMASRLNEEFLAAAPGLRWIHSLTAGVETLLSSKVLAPGCIVTSARGMHGPQMAEMALLAMMSVVRRFPRMLANQAAGRWERWQQPMLLDKHVVIVGVGAAAEAIAPACKAMGMRVTGVASRQREVPAFDAIRLRRDLPELLAEADFVILLLPLDDSTRGLFGRDMLARLAPHAVLVNMSRGGVVDEAALGEALRAGRFAGCAMDVFEKEPLPPDDPIWQVPRLIVTPHVAGWSDRYSEQSLVALCANLEALQQGRPEALVNRVR